MRDETAPAQQAEGGRGQDKFTLKEDRPEPSLGRGRPTTRVYLVKDGGGWPAIWDGSRNVGVF